MSNILAIDIGSSKICALIARVENNKPVVVGSGVVRSQGLKKGAIINIDEAARAIKAVVADASKQAGVEISEATVSVSGAYTKSTDSIGTVASIPSKEIKISDINRAMQSAIYHANINTTEYDILHALPYNFKVDDQCGVQDPLGMSGTRLEMSLHIVIAQKSALENLKKAIYGADIEIKNMVLASYASSIAVLGDEEKELGACVIDMGGATCNMLVHLGNAPRFHDFLAVGGSHITSDLSMVIHTPLKTAETIKLDYGTLFGHQGGSIEIAQIGNESSKNVASLDTISTVIAARMEETLMILSNKLRSSQLHELLGAGVVITGGASKHEGLAHMAQPIFGNTIPVRTARAKEVKGISESLRDPIYSTVLGLIRYASGETSLYELDSANQLRAPSQETQKTGDRAQSANEQNLTTVSGEEKSELADITLMSPPKPNRLRQFWDWLAGIF